MTTYSLFVTSSPTDHAGAYTALQFAQALLKLGHHIKGVFFYQQGVHNANSFNHPLADETNLTQEWITLANYNNVELHICVTAASKRGVRNGEEAAENNSTHYNLEPPFLASGLGEWVSLVKQSDKVVQF
ncbi:sulfurtransferase complex subunit TusD [Neptunicella marina]|uniref:Sulfurtransferase complex subunit TusD n=1 Tax=Neptunicella marina TaxID=2125989 RepID=A0A8J6M492_9ALTE|nr:sulfurtransferase complex subunit TusD [Neptunicella marina]MBC3767752.1 sulfurtransferase complex subunit TusD [Neptunicella marina]